MKRFLELPITVGEMRIVALVKDGQHRRLLMRPLYNKGKLVCMVDPSVHYDEDEMQLMGYIASGQKVMLGSLTKGTIQYLMKFPHYESW